MGNKKRTEEWYERLNKQFLEDKKTHDFSNPEMDKWFWEMLNEKIGEEHKENVEEWYERLNKQFLEDSKTHDYSDPEMDKWFAEMLDRKMRLESKRGTKEWYEEINKQFEEDCKTGDYTDTDMDKIFAEMLDREIRKYRKRKITKVASVAAGIVLLSFVALNCFTQYAYGESVFDIIKNSIEAGKFTIFAFGKNDDSQFEDYDDATICYEADSIEELFEQIIDDTQIEIGELFYLKDLPRRYTQWDAKYNKVFQVLTINSRQQDDFLYVCEELSYENVVSGTILESEIASIVFNENLQMSIDIVKQTDNIRDKGYYFEVFYNNMRIKIEGNGELEEFEIIAKNISLVKGE